MTTITRVPEQFWSEWESRYETLSGGWSAWQAIQAIELDGWQRRTKAYPTQYEMRRVGTKGSHHEYAL